MRQISLLILVLACLPVSAAAGWVGISTVADGENGTVIVSGSTDLATGNVLLVEVVSSSFTPTNKSEPEGFSGASGTVTVEEGEPYNFWTFAIDAPLPPDTYLVTVTHPESGTEASGRFTLIGARVSGITAAATTAETTAATHETPLPAPTRAPCSLAAAVLGTVAAALRVRRH
ncbi:MAG: hypothetical protein PWP08_918 [Methanofollis sp.]|nr:hypothetical protein [Methanofollis sp.]